MRFSLPDGQTVAIDQPFDMAGIQYPANWLRLMTPAERLAFGAVELPEPPVVDGRYYSAPGVPHELNRVKTQRRADLAARRWDAEHAGVVVEGVRVSTDEHTRVALLGARMVATENASASFEWKTPSGFVDLTAAQMIAAADAVVEHIRTCFGNERGHLALIDAMTDPQAVIDHDIDTGWPTYSATPQPS